MKIFSVLLSVVYLFGNVAFANAAQTNFWTERQKSRDLSEHTQLAALPTGMNAARPSSMDLLQQIPSIGKTLAGSALRTELPVKVSTQVPKDFQYLLRAIPVNAGKIREAYATPNSNKFVMLIQDVHMNREAQQNIDAMMKALGQEASVVTDRPLPIGVEGASVPFDFSAFHAFPDQKIITAVADSYLHQNRISAPSHLGMTTSKLATIFGIDDEMHYQANVTAYKSAVTQRKTLSEALDKQKQILHAEKENVLNPELKKFDGRRTAYETGAMSFGDYVLSLQSLSEQESDADADLVLEQFVAAYRMEKSLNLGEVERQRGRVVEELARQLNADELKQLVEDSISYRIGKLSYAGYYQTVQTHMKRHNIPLSQYPAFDQYVRYVLLSDGIDAEKLFSSVKRLEAHELAALCKTPNETKLMSASQLLFLQEKLLDFALTPDEWQEYRKLSAVSSQTSDLKPFEQFYEEADIRSEKMVANLLAATTATSIMLVGGFHTPGVTALLKKNGVSFAVVQPQLTKLDDSSGTEYLSIFSREMTQLEKLFEGEKLFLAPQALHATPRSEVAAEAGAVATALEKPGTLVAIDGLEATSDLNAPMGHTAVGRVDVEGGYGQVQLLTRWKVFAIWDEIVDLAKRVLKRLFTNRNNATPDQGVMDKSLADSDLTEPGNIVLQLRVDPNDKPREIDGKDAAQLQSVAKALRVKATLAAVERLTQSEWLKSDDLVQVLRAQWGKFSDDQKKTIRTKYGDAYELALFHGDPKTIRKIVSQRTRSAGVVGVSGAGVSMKRLMAWVALRKETLQIFIDAASRGNETLAQAIKTQVQE